mgnify:CR=1 FL=1
MSVKIKKITSQQILDSRGYPTVEVTVSLTDGTIGRSSVPSGASTGEKEALELRDNGDAWCGKGISKALKNIEAHIAPKIIGQSPYEIQKIDLDYEGTRKLHDKWYHISKEEFQNMSLEDKIAQMIIVRINGEFHNNENWHKKNVMRLIKNKHIGGLVTYTGSVHGTFYNLKEFQETSNIPLFIAADYERGVGQFLDDGTLFPSNMAVAATGNPENAYKQGKITAIEAKAIGVNMILKLKN